MTGALLAAGLACMLAGVGVDLGLGTRSRVARIVPYLLGAAGSGCLLAVGVHATLSAPAMVDIAPLFDVGRGVLRVDALAGLFMTVLFGIAVAVSLCAASWAWPEVGRAHRRAAATGYLALLASVAVVVCAADAFVFLFAWEALTVSFYLLTSAQRGSAEAARAPWATVGIGKVSGACLLLGFLLLAGQTHSFTIAHWSAVRPGALHAVAWVLVVAGFAAKLGTVPFQVWIPVGYPAAPGPSRAAMAGIAANVGVYGLWRFLAVLGRPPVWLVVTVLLAGGVTAFLGILFAGVQSRLSRVVAYSSIEHAGIILVAYGVALTGLAVGSRDLQIVGLVAGSLQMVAHAVAKSTLFCSLAFVEADAGTDDLDALRGVARRLRWSGAAFGAGALALAGLPPTIGFVSEWFVLEALMQQFRLGGLALRLGLAGAGALVALTTGLAALAFLRVLALTFLGRPARSTTGSGEAGPLGRAGLAALGLGCLALAAATPWEVRFFALGLAPILPRGGVLQALKSPWVLQPVYHGFSILSPSWLWIVLPVACVAVLGMAALFSRGRYLRVRRVPAWRSATSGVAGASSYTAFGFANPLRHVLGNVLATQRTRQLQTAALTTSGDEGAELGVSGDVARTAHLESRTSVAEPFEAYLYRPAWKAVRTASDLARRLQSGSLNAYVAYMLVALVIALAVAAAMR
ncbi:MAG TPA: proton-conducting transporter membrane subunit [Acidimicrobiales bacterium]|nr:proton-conducting transporter membrane subunit [Acidimicrobiales bacterium]